MANKKFTELTQASAIDETDIVATSQYSGGMWSSLKATISQIANKIVSGINYNSLSTTDKTIIGAINEAAQSGGSGGHTILDDNGTALSQEDNLQFVGVYSEDDSVNDTTKVNIVREMTQAQYDLLSADEKKGIIRITDKDYVCEASDVVYDTLNEISVEDELNAKVDWKSNGILGAKNLLLYPWFHTSGRVNRGITFSFDEEGYIALNGTADASSQPFFEFTDTNPNQQRARLKIISGKKYKLTIDRTDDRIWSVIYIRDSSGSIVNVALKSVYEDGTVRTLTTDYVSLNYSSIIHSSVIFEITTSGEYYIQIDLRVNNNSGSYSSSTDKARVMLRLAEDTDDTWKPFAMTNKELTDIVNYVPTTAGTYTLQAVRDANGGITYSWV